MPKFTVKAGKHYHQWPPISTLPWVGQQSMERLVTFSPNCAYDSAPYNSQDVNKLFGLSFGLGGVHHNSARFGWRYSMADKCIELLAYCYLNGQRNWDEQLRFPVVQQVQPGQQVRCEIRATYDMETGLPIYEFDTSWTMPGRAVEVPRPADLPHYGLTHGLYFGGALPAPHTMAVQINRP